jgi:hypothetical protein
MVGASESSEPVNEKHLSLVFPNSLVSSAEGVTGVEEAGLASSTMNERDTGERTSMLRSWKFVLNGRGVLLANGLWM